MKAVKQDLTTFTAIFQQVVTISSNLEVNAQNVYDCPIPKQIDLSEKNVASSNIVNLKVPIHKNNAIFFWAKINEKIFAQDSYTLGIIKKGTELIYTIKLEKNKTMKTVKADWQLVLYVKKEGANKKQPAVMAKNIIQVASDPREWFFVQFGYNPVKQKIRLNSMFNIEKSSKPNRDYGSAKKYNLNEATLYLIHNPDSQSKDVSYNFTISRLCTSIISFALDKQKLQKVAEYGYAHYKVLIPFHQQKLNVNHKLRNFVQTDDAKLVKINFSRIEKGKYLPENKFYSPFFPDYNPNTDSKPFVNHFNQLMVSGIDHKKLGVHNNAKIWLYSVVQDLDVNKTSNYVEFKLNERDESFRIYELLNDKNEVVLQLNQNVKSRLIPNKKGENRYGLKSWITLVVEQNQKIILHKNFLESAKDFQQKLRAEVIYYSYWHPTKKVYETFVNIRVNNKSFKRQLIHYTPNISDKHLFGIQSKVTYDNLIPFYYDFNLITVTSGIFLGRKHIFNSGSKQILLKTGIIKNETKLQDKIQYALDKTSVHDNNCLQWNNNAQSYYNLLQTGKKIELGCTSFEQLSNKNAIQNCRVYNKQEICMSCKRGFYLTDENTCMRCLIKNCDLCYRDNQKKCYSCKLGYFYNETDSCEKITSEFTLNPIDNGCRITKGELDVNTSDEIPMVLTTDMYTIQKDGERKFNRVIFNLEVDFKEKGKTLQQSRDLQVFVDIVINDNVLKGPSVQFSGEKRVVPFSIDLYKNTNFHLKINYKSPKPFTNFEKTYELPIIKMTFNKSQKCHLKDAQVPAPKENEKTEDPQEKNEDPKPKAKNPDPNAQKDEKDRESDEDKELQDVEGENLAKDQKKFNKDKKLKLQEDQKRLNKSYEDVEEEFAGNDLESRRNLKNMSLRKK